MIQPDGRVLLNLDEFMLRLGHVTIACLAASELGGSTYRITQELRERLTNLVPIPPAEHSSIARYLAQKGLCRIHGKPSDNVSQLRYPEIQVTGASEDVQIEADVGEPLIWWQDYMLAQPPVKSRVGGITVNAKSGSKSGLSHVLDWAALLDVITSNGDLLGEGRLITNITGTASDSNPYALGLERVVYGWRYLHADFDLVATLAPLIIQRSGLIRRRDATELFVSSIQTLETVARDSRSLSNRQYETIYAAYNDLKRAADKAGKPLASTSTAWHRASSRFETLVDLGLLRKAPEGSPEAAYTYQYAPTDQLLTFVETISRATDVEDWFEGHFIATLLPNERSVTPNLADGLLLEAIELAGSSSALIPIDTLILALTVCSARLGDASSVGEWRAALLQFAREKPDIARLSAGRYGRGAEFISIRRKRLGAA